MIQFFAQRLAEEYADGCLPELSPDATLVPVPKSAVMMKNALWPSRRICEEMVAHGIGREVLLCLERRATVPKAAFSKPEDRPTAQKHYDSMSAESGLHAPDQLIVVDDIITRGAQMIAAVSLVARVFPASAVIGFAAARTIGGEIGSVLDPCSGIVTLYSSGGTRRRP